ncbi:hypothetical protein RSOLAG22IIIB_08465 [Rhizoctonia solani]|uniref:Uncharacterized protein n=1 Tax=Rhizoctonia solani TaxID=456999 RepID=A0A0K6FTW0_9AGAM|nr:hypothetical protein RSOLAG22IIIB_08465 [Rhizoctonia solani]
MIPVTSANMIGQEVWARMPGRPGEPTGVESNVELMGFVLSEHWLSNQKLWRCKAFESHGVWTSHPEEEVLNIKSIRMPLSNGAQFKYQQQVSVRTTTDHWVVNGNIVPKTGRIEAGWCERSPSSNGPRLKYSYWIRAWEMGQPPHGGANGDRKGSEKPGFHTTTPLPKLTLNLLKQNARVDVPCALGRRPKEEPSA